MSRKRFGRNQKRKLRQELANCKEAHSMDQALLKHMSSKLEYSRSQLEYSRNQLSQVASIVESVCYNSVALPPKVVTGDYPGDPVRIAQSKPLSYSQMMDNSLMLPNHTIDLYKLDALVHQNRERMEVAVHLMYSGKKAVYRISEAGFMHIPTEEITNFLIPKIASKLMGLLRGTQ